jgi:nitrogen-specific signal transduction histidine kinase
MDMEIDKRKALTDQACSQEELLRRYDELQILLDISSALHSSPRLEDVLQQALMAILRTLKFKMGAVYLVEELPDRQWQCEIAAVHGFSATFQDCIRTFQMSSRQIEKFLHCEPVQWLTPQKVVFPKLRERMIEEKIREIICISLLTQKRVLGFLYVTNDGQLQMGPQRGEFLTTIGHQIGTAIENAQLFDSVQRVKRELEISFDAVQHSFFIIDPRQRILFVNKSTESVYGSSDHLVGQYYTQLLYGSDRPPATCPIRICSEELKPIRREGPHPRWGGYYHFYAFPVLSRAGALERVVYYEKDATEAKKLEQQLQQSERLKALGTLAAGMAHEIRNPLATINFNSQMLQRELGLNDGQQQMFSDIVQEIKKIDRIVQQVLHFARPSDPQFMPNQLNDIISYCHDMAKVHLRKASIEFSAELDESLPSLIMDFDQISQVVMNLLINAIEAMPEGGRLGVRTTQSEDPPAVVVEISDTGSGILPEDENQIFNPFFTRKSEGTGLGLSISRQIMDKHGAYLEFESRSGEGTTFRMVFPLEAKVRQAENSFLQYSFSSSF